jgi:septum formation protein
MLLLQDILFFFNWLTWMLENKLHKYNIILASQSPRRQSLLKELGFTFQVSENHNLDEFYPENLDKFQIPVYLSESKSSAYGNLNGNDLLITADTIVWLKDHVIGKPSDFREAVNILLNLSENMHEVITGVTLRTRSRVHSFYSHTEVYFAKISKSEIDYYVRKFKPYDKAGAYGIQEWIGFVAIEKINGSFHNVMGLPIQKLYRVLEDFIE